MYFGLFPFSFFLEPIVNLVVKCIKRNKKGLVTQNCYKEITDHVSN